MNAREKKIFFSKKIMKYFPVKKIFIVHCSLFILFSSCSKEKIIFEKNYDIAQHQWLYKDSLSFSFDVKDTTAAYDIELTIKHDNNYPFQNLYTTISTVFPNNARVLQTLNLDLADNTGKWDGSKDAMNRVSTIFKTKIKSDAFFSVLGKHTITLSQFTRQDTLSGVESVGLALIQKQIR